MKKSSSSNNRSDVKSTVLYVCFVVLIFALCFGIVFGAVSLIFKAKMSAADTGEYTFTYKYGSKTVAVSSKDAYYGGELYVDFSEISLLCSMAESGTESKMIFSVSSENEDDSAETLVVTPGSSIAEVNGSSQNMSSECLKINGHYWLPTSFVTEVLTGVDCLFDSKSNTFSVSRTEKNSSTPVNPKYEELGFSYKSVKTIAGISESDAEAMEKSMFIADLSEYEQYMNPADRDAYLLLVNKTHTLEASYVPDNLCDVAYTRTDREKVKMVDVAEMALRAMYIEAAANGITDVSVTSAYRSYNSQSWYFNYYISVEMQKGLSKDAAEAQVLTYSAAPGTSEHQSGLCCDMHNLSSADNKFAETAAYKWFSENCWKFGFILRFPEGKEEITGYQFESWHFRFVGRYHAAKIYEQGLCLEEYLEELD